LTDGTGRGSILIQGWRRGAADHPSLRIVGKFYPQKPRRYSQME
jgi:hypothetical protein